MEKCQQQIIINVRIAEKQRNEMGKIIGVLAILLGLVFLSLTLSTHPALILGPALVGLGTGFLIKLW